MGKSHPDHDRRERDGDDLKPMILSKSHIPSLNRLMRHCSSLSSPHNANVINSAMIVPEKNATV
jgi:hypothetical protein